MDKRRAGPGRKGGNLTPAQAKTVLAVPVVALLSNQATIVGPHANLASRSGLVAIYPGTGGCAKLVGGRVAIFPVWVNGRQWERAVVPVLTDPRWDSTLAVWQATASTNLTSLVDMIGNALAQSFHDAGYGPLP